MENINYLRSCHHRAKAPNKYFFFRFLQKKVNFFTKMSMSFYGMVHFFRFIQKKVIFFTKMSKLLRDEVVLRSYFFYNTLVFAFA